MTINNLRGKLRRNNNTNPNQTKVIKFTKEKELIQ